jgi:hypothetical protein
MKISVSPDGVFVNGKRARRLQAASSRKCYIADGIIVKLNDSDCFTQMRQSSRELRIWQQLIEPCDKKYFARPIAGQIRGNGWIAERIIKFRRGRKPQWAWKLAEYLADKYGILRDCRERDGSFAYSTNWGIRDDGRFVCYDWGY